MFSKIKPMYRYQDIYYSPLEFMNKNFTQSEILLFKTSPQYFGLNKFPFVNSNFEFSPTLLSKLNFEDNTTTKNYDKKSINKKLDIEKQLEKRMQKLKEMFREKVKKLSKRKPIKGIDFISHYEREYEEDEGTVQYFERKYLKYLKNKNKRMEEKIDYVKYKKEQFEKMLKERKEKLEEAKNVQKITSPIINNIKKIYLKLK